MTTALLHDHTARLRKPRTCHIVLEYRTDGGSVTGSEAVPENFLRIASVQSNGEKCEKWISDNNRDGFTYVVERWSVV